MRKEFTYDKQTLRRKLIELRAGIEDKPERSHAITESVLPLLRGNVMAYVSIGSEADTTELISRLVARSGVTVFAPYTDADGIIVPRRVVSLGKVDKRGNMPDDCYAADVGQAPEINCCVTPLLAFDGDGYRLGYGKGCYDRFFANADTFKIGLAFDAQRARFKRDITDIPLDCCVTESKVLYFKHASNFG